MQESAGEAEGAEGEYSEWGSDNGRAAEVLRLVLCWVEGRELARCGAVCRAWRRAAATPALWRRLLRAQQAAPPQALRALQAHLARYDTDEEEPEPEDDDIDAEWSWRDEYVRAVAGWRLVRIMRPPSGDIAADTEQAGDAVVGDPGTPPIGDPEPPSAVDAGPPSPQAGAPMLQHTALTDAGDALVTCADDATVTVWVRTNEEATMWRATWRTGLRRRGWRAAARAQWAPSGAGAGDGAGGPRLLVAGPLQLAERWELCVLQLGATYRGGRVLARAGASAGAAGCWAGRAAFLSLELRLLAPRRGVTTLWLNAATQEAESEFTGVATPVLRVYNEAQTHLSHVIVVEVPEGSDDGDAEAQYIRAMHSRRTAVADTRRVVVAGCGLAGGGAGLACWPLRALCVPPLCAAAAGGLAERVARRRHAVAARAAQPEPPAPSEDELRALCSPPAATCHLTARLVGLAPHPSGRCVWAVDAAGRGTCAALPGLAALRVLEPRHPPPPAAHAHYVHPAVSEDFIISPVGGYSGRLQAWSSRSGACVSPPPPAPAPASAALLPRPRTLLLLAGDHVQIWESRAPPQRES